jgi:hypothetical protein
MRTSSQKEFFFEKKNQKTFASLRTWTNSKRAARAKEQKFFCFFFSKNKSFLPAFFPAILLRTVALPWRVVHVPSACRWGSVR